MGLTKWVNTLFRSSKAAAAATEAIKPKNNSPSAIGNENKVVRDVLNGLETIW